MVTNLRITIACIVLLILVGCGSNPIESTVQYVHKAASGTKDSDHDGTPEEYVIGVFTVVQTREFVDINHNGIMDTNEVYKDGVISLTFDHNTDFRGFIEFTASGEGWTFSGDLDLSSPHQGVMPFGVISSQIKSINPGTTVQTTRIINYPTGPG